MEPIYGNGAVLLLLRFIGGFMSYSKEVNRYVFPLIATNIAQLLINQLSLHFAVNDSSVALSGISVIQNFLFAFGGILGLLACLLISKGRVLLQKMTRSVLKICLSPLSYLMW